MSQRGRRAGWPLVALAGLAITVAGCSGSSSDTAASTSPRATPGTPPAFAAVHALERALLANKGSPRPTAATCRAATAAEAAHGPFGADPRHEFTCRLVVGGSAARYAVQIQANGCYVAERHRPGRAIYGCGVRAGG